ncbi:hypothetical protein [Streptomyces sp. SID9124]|uniref:hypothetical protein n=1 Tax=Streptomyces sp. SID9124 TaxID=2706108 RepID=UPI0013E076C5|nr:hypothetical protein [Streptomyces sp. SID9124]NED15804.1 hypothetical protein [Streptomyces sp. SID9124]
MNDFLSHESLQYGAQKFANTAMDAHAREDDEVFLLHAGVSVERLAKSALARTSPFLLLEMKGKEDSLLHIAGVKQALKVRTVGASQAISRLRTIGILPDRDADLDELIELRNGIAHLDASADESFDGLSVFVKTTNCLLSHLGVDRSRYWGSWFAITEITESEALQRAEREVAREIERARHRLRQRLDGVPEDAVSIIYKDASAAREGMGTFGLNMQCGLYSFQSPKECPACHCRGRLVINLPLIGTGPAEGFPDRWFYCPLCAFSARGDDELEACGISKEEMFLASDGTPTTLDASMFAELMEIGFIERSEVDAVISHFAPDAET